jgi:2-methylcitrate dehydratase
MTNTRAAPHFDAGRVKELVSLTQDLKALEEYDVDKYVDLYVKN